MCTAIRFVLVSLLAFGSMSCSKECPPEKVCPECKICPECPECPTCPECPQCPPKVEAVGSTTIVSTDRDGPRNFIAATFVMIGGEWKKLGSAMADEAKDVNEVATREFLGYPMFRWIKENPDRSGAVTILEMSDYICHKAGKTLSCWILSPLDRGKLFTSFMVTVL